MALVQLEHLVPSSGVVVKDEGERDDKEIGDGGSGMYKRCKKRKRAATVRYSQTWWGETRADHADEALNVFFKLGQAGAGFVKTPWAGGTGDRSVVTANDTKAPLAFDFEGPALRRSDRRCRAGKKLQSVKKRGKPPTVQV